MQRLALTSAALLLVAACASPLGPAGSDDLVPEGQIATLTPSQERYAAGEPAAVVLLNRSQQPVGYGACEPRLERKTASGWILIGPESVVCIDILYVIPPGGSAEFSLATSGLEAGTYRFRLAVYPDTSLPTRTIRSPSFEVQP